ncbi:Unknown protein, partial [Striga hermonthica]
VEGRPERRARGHPFSREILAAPLPASFREINLVFDGSSDPSRHVRAFENMSVLHGYSDPVSCRAFLSTLQGGALDWFHQLAPGSIRDFEDFAGQLTNQYSSAVAQEKTYLTLMAMRQGEKESLRKYVARYNQVCLEVPTAGDEVKAGGLIRSLRPGPCRTSLAKTPARTYDEVLKRCKKYINLEETEAEFAKLEDVMKPEQRKGKMSSPRRGSPRKNSPRGGSFKRPSPGGMGKIRSEKGERIAGRGDLGYQMVRGPTDGDSNNARKGHVRAVKRKREEVGITGRMPVISFRAEDAEGILLPHNDALVITAEVAGFDVKRIFIDTGSSVDVMFYDCFAQINKHLNLELKPVATALYGFNGGEVMPMGEVSLTVALGTGDSRKVRMIRFVVVGAESSYNIILGRTGLNAFQAVVSTYHTTIKYPVGEKVGEIAGDQLTSRSCYQTIVNLGEPIRSKLINLIREFTDVFAYTTDELTGIEARVIEHRLNIDLSVRPVKQKRRHHGAEMDKIIEQEVDKLMNAGHIQKIQFPEWLSNTVMVSKAGGKWRMCIDFRDLNKACPKDLYPLPRIDQLVDSTAGCKLLSLMDASQGYHQIPLAKEDWKRVSFITSKGTYCYVVMPFGLKNAGATYQRLVDQIFKDQLGRNMEVYVDDMLVKSKMEADHVGDLRETFQTLRRYGMKLNPTKCSFGVKAGKFLGYMVTKRGIEVNPEKVRAVVEMKPPTSVKEVQILTGRIAGLSRFIFKVAEKSSPLFKTLKKSSKFQWTEEAQKAFEELQRTLANLPLLAKPVHGEELVLYISVGESAVSSVLVREEGVAQFPIYYVSRVMQGAELRYSEIEKFALAVVVTVRKLRPYFLNHKVKVRTNMPLEQTLGRPAVSGRLVKWAVELSEYSITYEPRRAIKAQVLADFIQEGTKEEGDGGGMW